MRRIIIVLSVFCLLYIQVILLKNKYNVVNDMLFIICYGGLFRILITQKDKKIHFKINVRKLIYSIIFLFALIPTVIIPMAAYARVLDMTILMYLNKFPSVIIHIMNSGSRQTLSLFFFGVLLAYSFFEETEYVLTVD